MENDNVIDIATMVSARGCGTTSRQLRCLMNELDYLAKKAEDMILNTFNAFGYSHEWLFDNKDRVHTTILTHGVVNQQRFYVDDELLFSLVTIRVGLGIKVFIYRHKDYPRGGYECETK